MLSPSNNDILDRLQALRSADAPTHGGRLLSYVYDSGIKDIDELAAKAAGLALPVNGLDPTAFTSVPALERDLIAFAKKMLHASGFRGRKVQGTITSGGTESCMLAVKTARDLWRSENPKFVDTVTPKLVIAQTAHAAFHKAAHYFGLQLEIVPTDADGVVKANDIIARLDRSVAMVVVSAPSYPTAQLDPVREVAEAANILNISCHVDACIGGFALPWWEALPAWDFRIQGVTSISADLHKFGYAPKGVSVLLQLGLERHRKQFFSVRNWPGYPVVNPTMLGSRSATGLAAAWAIVQRLGHNGYAELTAKSLEATRSLVSVISNVNGLRVMGEPVGPLFAVASDESVPESQRVDPHHFADEMKRRGFLIQHQPGLRQASGVSIPHSAHFTITPVTLGRVDELVSAIIAASDAVRGKPRANPALELVALKVMGLLKPSAKLSPAVAGLLLKIMGVGGGSGALPQNMAPLMRILEELPNSVAETLLIEILARLSQPKN